MPNPAVFFPESNKKTIRSYVLRTGRMTAGQTAALRRHWPAYRLSLHEDKPVCWRTIFGREAPVVLEIGFGMGDSLLTMARAEPDKDFVGIEVYPPGVGHLIAQAVKENVGNLRVYLADATDVVETCIPARSLARVQVFFPDPWPKKKHHKRRLVQRAFVDRVTEKLSDHGILHLATDWQPYAEHMREILDNTPALQNIQAQGGNSARPDYRPPTKFERRGEKLGHGIWDLIYRRNEVCTGVAGRVRRPESA